MRPLKYTLRAQSPEAANEFKCVCIYVCVCARARGCRSLLVKANSRLVFFAQSKKEGVKLNTAQIFNTYAKRTYQGKRKKEYRVCMPA